MNLRSDPSVRLWRQRPLLLAARSRGCHLITSEITTNLPDLAEFEIGMLHLFLQHTSASISLNENSDPDVRHDLEDALNRISPENAPYRHTCEGQDDMPAHVKATLIGPELTIPITGGGLALGMWQGIYLCEHRNRATPRRLVATMWGEP